MSGCEGINDEIGTEPESAGELVAYNAMLDGLESRVAFLEERLEYLRELYDLMGEFNMPIPPDDMTEYLGIFNLLARYSNHSWPLLSECFGMTPFF